jgi:hypothetical protein
MPLFVSCDSKNSLSREEAIGIAIDEGQAYFPSEFTDWKTWEYINSKIVKVNTKIPFNSEYQHEWHIWQIEIKKYKDSDTEKTLFFIDDESHSVRGAINYNSLIIMDEDSAQSIDEPILRAILYRYSNEKEIFILSYNWKKIQLEFSPSEYVLTAMVNLDNYHGGPADAIPRGTKIWKITFCDHEAAIGAHDVFSIDDIIFVDYNDGTIYGYHVYP